VGLVHLAAALRDGEVRHRRRVFPGNRAAIRLATLEAALVLALELVEPGEAPP
jgi:nicotinamide-nucleotide amidase